MCGHKDSYTSDRSFLLFTEDAGMVWASARSVREERSKQRPALQDFSLVRVSLVKGKTGWKIGSVSVTENFYSLSTTRESRGAVTSIIRLVRQYLQGEELQPAVFADTVAALESAVAAVVGESIVDMFKLRFLYHLGYIAPHESFMALLQDPHWFREPQSLPATALRALQRADQASHL